MRRFFIGRVAWWLVAGAALLGLWMVVDGPRGPGVAWLVLAAAGVVMSVWERPSEARADGAE